MYINSSNAYKLDDFRIEQRAEEERRKLLAQKKRRILERKRMKKRFVAFTVFVAIVAFAALCQNAFVAKEFEKLNEKREKSNLLEAQIIKKENSIQSMIDLDNVEKVATEKLGMHRPEKNQTIYVSHKIESKGEIVKSSNSKNVVKGFISKLGSILQYLY